MALEKNLLNVLAGPTTQQYNFFNISLAHCCSVFLLATFNLQFWRCLYQLNDFRMCQEKKDFVKLWKTCFSFYLCVFAMLSFCFGQLYSQLGRQIHAFKKINKNHISRFKTKAKQTCYWQYLFQGIVNVLIYKLKYMGTKDMIDNKCLIAIQKDRCNKSYHFYFHRKCKL